MGIEMQDKQGALMFVKVGDAGTSDNVTRIQEERGSIRIPNAVRTIAEEDKVSLPLVSTRSYGR
jgi:hypothetical protein